MGSKKPPKPPDFTAAAEKEAQSSKENLNTQNFANRPNQRTPFGGTSWDTEARMDPATGQMVTGWTQNSYLSPQLQRALDQQMMLQEGRSDVAGGMYDRLRADFDPIVNFDDADPMGDSLTAGAYDTSGIMPLQDPYQTRQRAEDAIYDKARSRLDPRFASEEAAIESKLRNQGLRPGTEAWEGAMSSFGRNKNDAYNQAQYGAITGGMEEARGMYGMDSGRRQQQIQEMLSIGGQRFGERQTASGFNTSRRQQQIAETLQRRGVSLNEINALLTGQQVNTPNMPSFNASGRAETTGYSAAAKNQGEADLNRWSAGQQAKQAMMSGITDMAGSFMPM